MKLCIIIPFYNEEHNIRLCLNSFAQQSRKPDRIILVNDNSNDNSPNIAKEFSDKYDFIEILSLKSKQKRIPGAKVINAFYHGFKKVGDFDLIGKFDADVILPQNYFENILSCFKKQSNLGICSGLLYIKKKEQWVYESIADKKHVRGPIKLYTKKCFEAIGGLRPILGWDTIDVLLSECNGFKTQIIPTLHVKHMRPTGADYCHSKNHFENRGETLYKIGYDFFITIITALKIALKNASFNVFKKILLGYFKARKKKLRVLSKQEIRCIKKLRYLKILKKITL